MNWLWLHSLSSLSLRLQTFSWSTASTIFSSLFALQSRSFVPSLSPPELSLFHLFGTFGVKGMKIKLEPDYQITELTWQMQRSQNPFLLLCTLPLEFCHQVGEPCKQICLYFSKLFWKNQVGEPCIQIMSRAIHSEAEHFFHKKKLDAQIRRRDFQAGSSSLLDFWIWGTICWPVVTTGEITLPGLPVLETQVVSWPVNVRWTQDVICL